MNRLDQDDSFLPHRPGVGYQLPGLVRDLLVRTITPIVLALVCGGVVIWMLGANPFDFYANVVEFGLSGSGWQLTLVAMAPLLLVALGLITAFRAGLWNLGYGGAYLLPAALVAGFAPDVFRALPYGLGLLALFAMALVAGALLAIVPAWLKARYGVTEVVTTLMVSFIAMGLANLLVKGPLQDRTVTLPQTRVLEQGLMLPYLPGTKIHIGFAIAVVLVVLMHIVLMRTSFGVSIDVLGANPRVAAHVGIDVKRLTITVLVLSTGLVVAAGAVDMLGLWGYVRADWNPAYGDKILPFVFLARLNPLGSIPLVTLYAVLATGGTYAAGQAGLSVDFLLVLVALMLFFMTAIEYLGTRRALGSSYLPRIPSMLERRDATGGEQ